MKKGGGLTKGCLVLAVLGILGLLAAVVLFIVVVVTVIGGEQENETAAGGTCRATATEGTTGSIPAQWRDEVQDAAAVSGVPAAVLAAQIDKESGWNETAVNESSGAAGMAQAMPGTWELYGEGDPMNGADAIQFMGRYMGALMDLAAEHTEPGTAQVEAALGAYNWGDGNMAAHGWDWTQGPDETTDYVPTIMDRAQVEFSEGCAAVAWDGDLGDGEWTHPLPGSELTGGGAYGLRNVPGLPAWAQNHVGLDFATPNGGPVIAPFDSVVTAIYDPDGCVMAKGTDDPRFGYAVCHLNDWEVQEGMNLTRGDVIGSEGTRAASVGVGVVRHLHFELYSPEGGDPQYPGPDNPDVIDPTQILREKGVL